MPSRRLSRRSRTALASAFKIALTAAVVLSVSAVTTLPAQAAQTIGYPTFNGPAVPAPPVRFSTGNTMQAIFDAESGGTDYWMDRLLARPGNDPAGTW